MDWINTRHPGNVTEDGVVTLDDLIHYWGKTSQVCDFNIADVVLPSDAEYLTLTLHIQTLKDPGILGAHSPYLCSIERKSALYARNLVGRDNRLTHHIFFNDAITEDARAIRLLLSDTH